MNLELLSKETAVRRLGEIPYQEAYALQQILQQERMRDKIPDTILLLTHPSVYTMGKDNVDAKTLIHGEIHAPLELIDRGGKITYHGPGQLVGYFICKLPRSQLGTFINDIENITLEIAKRNGLRAFSRKTEVDSYDKNIRGAWVLHNRKPRKIAAQGISTLSYNDLSTKEPTIITMHGFAFNVNTDLTYFDHIAPCGFNQQVMTSLQEVTGKPIDFEKFTNTTADIIKEWEFNHYE